MADFKLGRIKFKWRGDWSVTTGYVIDDIAKYGGNAYVCIKNHTSPANENLFYTDPGTYTEYWTLHQESIYFKGQYANGVWYKLNDLVSYGGKQYRTTTAHTAASAVLNQSNFEQFSDGIIFRGDYASSTQYRLNDLVKYGGRTYRVSTEHTSAAGGDANIVLGNFTLYSEGLAFRGDYQIDTYYRLDDVVKWGGYQTRCTTAHMSGNNLSDFAEANWSTYSDGLQWEDSYNASTLYQKGDVVTYGGYSYVYINADESTGQTPADNAYWDVITTGFNAVGVYVHGTVYKTGDTVQYGGNSYVCIANNTNERCAQADGSVNATYWKVVIEGFYWRGAYSAVTTYNVGDTVRYIANTYLQLKDQSINVTPGTDPVTWQIVAAGDSGAVMTTRGDLTHEALSGTARLPIGLAGAVLTNDGEDVLWSGASAKNVLWVSPTGLDTNPGSESLPYQTLTQALHFAKSNAVREIKDAAGGTGGIESVYNDVLGHSSKEFTVLATPSSTQFTIQLGTSALAHTYVDGGVVRKTNDTTLTVTDAPYNNSTGVITITTGTHGLSALDTVRISGLNYTCSKGAKVYPEVGEVSVYKIDTVGGTPKIHIVNGSAFHNVDDCIRVDGTQLGGSNVLNFKVRSVAGDIIRLKNGTFKEKFPLTVRENVSIVGESLRNTRIQPDVGSGTQIATVEILNNTSGATDGYYNYLHPASQEQEFTVNTVPDSTSFTIDLGTSGLVHTYIDGGVITKSNFSKLTVTDAPYNNVTGLITITTTPAHGLSVSDTIKISGMKYYCLEGQKTYPDVGTGSVWNVIVKGGAVDGLITYHGGSDYSVGDVLTLASSQIGNGGDLVFKVKKLEDNNACNMYLLNEKNNVRNMTFSGLTGRKLSGGLYQVDTIVDSDTFKINLGTSTLDHTYIKGGHVIKVGTESTVVGFSDAQFENLTGVMTFDCTTPHNLSVGDWVTVGKMKWSCPLGEKVYPSGPYESAVMSLDPTGNIYLTSPYIQNCTSLNPGACGVQVDGHLHGPNPRSYKSMLANDFTQINEDGIGIHILGKGRVEAVSVFVYYCDKAVYAESGGFIRALNCSHAYGEQGVVASGNDEDEVPVNIKTRGLMLKYDQTAFGGIATESDIGDSIAQQGQGTATIVGNTSGATATLFRYNISLDYLHIENVTGNFKQGETVTITKEDSSTFTVDLDASFGGLPGSTSGDIVSATAHGRTIGDLIELRDIVMSCPSGNKTYPIVSTNTAFTVEAANLSTTQFQVDLGTSSVAQTYVDGGIVKKADGTRLNVTNFVYDIATGKAIITTPTHGLSSSDTVNLYGIKTTCSFGTKIYPQAPYSGIYSVASTASTTKIGHFLAPSAIDHTYVSGGTVKLATPSNVGGSTAVSNFVYDNTTGIITVTSTTHGLAVNDLIKVENVLMTCSEGSKTYPDSTLSSGIFKVYDVVDGNTFKFGTDKSNLAHGYVSGGTIQKVTIATSQQHNISSYTFNRTGAAQQGQVGPLIAFKSGTSNLNASGVIKLANNLKFPGDNTFYRVGLVSEEDTTNQTAVVRLTAAVGQSKAKKQDLSVDSTAEFSNIRLTGHDFLDIGTGDFTTTNYPDLPTQPADQSDEVTEVNGGRVYWVSTDQGGDFRVGDLFKIEQATGSATLNADAFNLSGLSELQLGSIGAELGATINEFSTDQTLGGDSNTALVTENAIVGYMTRDQAGTGAWVPPTGTSAQRPSGGNLKTGALRYNADLLSWEGYNGQQWTGLGGGNPWATKTGDGSTIVEASANDRYLVDTTTYPITIKLPAAPLLGDAVVFLDLAGSFATNNLTVGRNGNDIMNLAQDMTVNTNHAGFTLVWTGATNGWKLVEVA